jgi:hypothetical protein
MMTYRATTLQGTVAGARVHFDLWRGLAEPPAVRGEDVTIPGADGITWMPKVADRIDLELRGFIQGLGADLVDRQETWRAATDAVMALFGGTLSPGDLVVGPDYLGLTAPRTIAAVGVDAIGGPAEACMTFQRWTVALVAHTPAWDEGS